MAGGGCLWWWWGGGLKGALAWAALGTPQQLLCHGIADPHPATGCTPLSSGGCLCALGRQRQAAAGGGSTRQHRQRRTAARFTWVVRQPAGDVVHLAGNDDPAVVGCVVRRDLCHGEDRAAGGKVGA